MEITIQGPVASGFEAVRDQFAANFARQGDYPEVGASFAAFHHGRCVVDLWGGHADAARMRPWQRDTLINIFSATKGIVAIAVAICVERGLFAYEDRVASVWPEFAANGKADVTIAQVLSHQSGLNGFAEPTTLKDLEDWDACCTKLAAQAPAWPPGTASSYHGLTYGWLAGELVRRRTGQSIGQFIRAAIAKPLGADVFIGLPEALEPRVAQLLPPTYIVDLEQAPIPAVAKLTAVNPKLPPDQLSRGWRAAEIPGANGQGTGYGLARIYSAVLAHEILKPQTVAQMTTSPTRGRADLLIGAIDCWGMGIALNSLGIYGPNPRAFGFSGWGGSFGCADPDADVTIGYVCNHMGPDVVGDPRTRALCQAVFESAAQHGPS
jgi:CubicO group peptidase (beta-lactamase class C family)